MPWNASRIARLTCWLILQGARQMKARGAERIAVGGKNGDRHRTKEEFVSVLTQDV